MKDTWETLQQNPPKAVLELRLLHCQSGVFLYVIKWTGQWIILVSNGLDTGKRKPTGHLARKCRCPPQNNSTFDCTSGQTFASKWPKTISIFCTWSSESKRCPDTSVEENYKCLAFRPLFLNRLRVDCHNALHWNWETDQGYHFYNPNSLLLDRGSMLHYLYIKKEPNMSCLQQLATLGKSIHVFLAVK